MPTYTLLGGDVLELDDVPAGEVERLHQLATSPYTAPDELLDELLEKLPAAPGAEDYRAPLALMLTDLWVRARRAGPPARPEDALTVAEAARELGLTPDAIRKSIHAGRLRARMWSNTWLIDPASVEGYAPSSTGRAPRLRVEVGVAAGAVFALKTDGVFEEEGVETHREEGSFEKRTRGEVRAWSKVLVSTSTREDGNRRVFELEPGTSLERVEFGGFFVEGRFQVARKINNARKAREAWEAWEVDPIGQKV